MNTLFYAPYGVDIYCGDIALLPNDERVIVGPLERRPIQSGRVMKREREGERERERGMEERRYELDRPRELCLR